MKITRLPHDQAPEADDNCITVQRRDDGRFDLSGTVLLACGDSDEAESVSLLGGTPYPSFDEAEAAGLAWAESHCVDEVVVATRPFTVE
jgi:hypothetical protein